MSSLLKKVGYFLATVRDVLAGLLRGELRASESVQAERKSVCDGSKTGAACEHYVPETLFGTPRCNECGCFRELKTSLRNAKCPLGKW